LFISHDLQMVELIAHQVIVMNLEPVVETGPRVDAVGECVLPPLFPPSVVRPRADLLTAVGVRLPRTDAQEVHSCFRSVLQGGHR
jgi:hypothetical protein